MATHGKLVTIPGLVATGSLAAGQYKVVKFASTAGAVKIVTATTDLGIGILMNDPTDGQAAIVAGPGSVAIGLAGANNIVAGESLGFNTTGQVVDHTTAGRWVIGQALSASTAVGDEIPVAIGIRHGYA